MCWIWQAAGGRRHGGGVIRVLRRAATARGIEIVTDALHLKRGVLRMLI